MGVLPSFSKLQKLINILTTEVSIPFLHDICSDPGQIFVICADSCCDFLVFKPFVGLVFDKFDLVF